MSILKDLVASPLDRAIPRMEKCPYEGSVERALWGGLHADRLGHAFAAGYGSALRHLFAHAGAELPSGTVCLACSARASSRGRGGLRRVAGLDHRP